MAVTRRRAGVVLTLAAARRLLPVHGCAPVIDHPDGAVRAWKAARWLGWRACAPEIVVLIIPRTYARKAIGACHRVTGRDTPRAVPTEEVLAVSGEATRGWGACRNVHVLAAHLTSRLPRGVTCGRVSPP